jgi:dihydrofolate synthase/folylpolyglutamate synthase
VNYSDSVDFLYKLGNEMKTAKLGLERMQALMQALGHPERAFEIVHVAGTNGKGSVCAMIDAGLRAAGVYTGLFTSPHLIEPTERIQIDDMPVSESEFARAFDVVHQTAAKLDLDAHPSYFETVTAMAFWLFRERRIKTAVVEVGLGGRLDATNIVSPKLTVITNVDMDHQSWLGDTIEQIAFEKAGILKSGVPAIFSCQRADAQVILDAQAAQLGVRVIHAADFAVNGIQLSDRSSSFVLESVGELHCPLAGEHQIENAVAAALALRELDVNPAGIEDAHWPGRIEHISPNPDVILDGAHNPAGARALARYLRQQYGNRKRWMIFAAMRDKDLNEVTQALFPLADELVFTAPDMARAMEPEELQKLAGRGRCAPNVIGALKMIAEEVTAEDAIIITGSLYLVGEARAASYNRKTWPFSGAWA